MLLGIDFGTTRTVVAAEDRGNYPLVAFKDTRGGWSDYFPSHVAALNGDLVFGHEAEALRHEPSAWHLTSFKRLLSRVDKDSSVEIPGIGAVAITDLLEQFLRAVRLSIVDGSTNASPKKGETLRAMISVPANANSNQRFMTLDAFRRAGFEVAGVLNEPSAAGVEYAHRYLQKGSHKTKEYLAVYDFGGGTFDAAAIRIGGLKHEVVANSGAERLGGDDFDRILFELALERLGESVSGTDAADLLAECRERKESLNPNTKKLLIDASSIGAGEIVVDAKEYYELCQPLVDQSVDLLEEVLAKLPDAEEGSLPASVATVYLVGGSASFPPVARALKERYGRRVQRSAYPHGAVALGLVIAGNADEPYFVRETLARHFGVWREADGGARAVFDPIFGKDTGLQEGLRASRSYQPAHNIGHFRFLECGSLAADGDPVADLTPWAEIAFPFDPALQMENGVAQLKVERLEHDAPSTIVEEYSCDTAGIVSVKLRDESTGYEKTYRLGREVR